MTLAVELPQQTLPGSRSIDAIIAASYLGCLCYASRDLRPLRPKRLLDRH
jgi:hypothetical protein